MLQSTLIQRSDRPIEVINAGLPGFCPLLSYAWARQRLASLQPDLVVLCCDGSDVADDRAVRPLACYAEDGVLQSVCHPAIGTSERSLFQAIEEEFRLAAFLGRHLGDYLQTDVQSKGKPDDWDHPIPVTEAADAIHIRQTWEPIAPIRDLCRQHSCDFVVALVPSREVAPHSLTGAPHEATRLLAEIAEEQGVPYLDVTAEFSPEVASGVFLDSTGALSTEGHAAFAELLSWAIVQRDQTVEQPEESPAPITPAAATAAPEPPATTIGGKPLPLPALGRRPRTDDAPFTGRK